MRSERKSEAGGRTASGGEGKGKTGQRRRGGGRTRREMGAADAFGGRKRAEISSSSGGGGGGGAGRGGRRIGRRRERALRRGREGRRDRGRREKSGGGGSAERHEDGGRRGVEGRVDEVGAQGIREAGSEADKANCSSVVRGEKGDVILAEEPVGQDSVEHGQGRRGAEGVGPVRQQLGEQLGSVGEHEGTAEGDELEDGARLSEEGSAHQGAVGRRGGVAAVEGDESEAREEGKRQRGRRWAGLHEGDDYLRKKGGRSEMEEGRELEAEDGGVAADVENELHHMELAQEAAHHDHTLAELGEGGGLAAGNVEMVCSEAEGEEEGAAGVGARGAGGLLEAAKGHDNKGEEDHGTIERAAGGEALREGRTIGAVGDGEVEAGGGGKEARSMGGRHVGLGLIGVRGAGVAARAEG